MYGYDTSNLQAYYYHRNPQGDVISIHSTNGTKVAEYAYDAYGNCTIVSGATSNLASYNPIRYRGYYYDRETSGFKIVDINLGETISMSTIMGLLNIFAGMGAGMSSVAGSMTGTAIDANSKFALKLLSDLTAGGTEAAYDISSYLINRLITAF